MQIEFKAINATLIEKYGGTTDLLDNNPDKPITKPESKTRLHYEIRASDGLNLATGENLKEIRGSLQLTPNADQKIDQKCIGYMAYIGDGYIIDIPLPKPQFDNLFNAARLGLIPLQIFVEFRREHTDCVDLVDCCKWDNKSGDCNWLYVSSIDFVCVLAETKSRVESGGTVHDEFLPPTRLQTRVLSQMVQKVNTQIFWLITAVSILGTLVIVFK